MEVVGSEHPPPPPKKKKKKKKKIWGPSELHSEDKTLHVSMRMGRVLELYSYMPSPPLSEILYPPLGPLIKGPILRDQYFDKAILDGVSNLTVLRPCQPMAL